MAKEKVIHARVDDVTHGKLLEKCNTLGCTMTDLLKSSLVTTLNSDNYDDLLDDEVDDESSDIEPKPLREKRPSLMNESEGKFEPHYDSHGHYYTYDKNSERWTCRLNPKNVRIAH